MDTSSLPHEASPSRWGVSLEAGDLSPIMLESDPRISRHLRRNRGNNLEEPKTTLQPLSDTLVLRTNCTKHEADIFDLAGHDLAMPLLSKVGRVCDDMTFQQDAVITSQGVPLSLPDILPQDRRSISLQITDLVSRLHAKGIVHGDINPSVMQWSSPDRLVFSDFSSARLADTPRDKQIQSCWDGNEDFISPRLRSNTRPGRCFFPTESDDLYATAVTIWCIWAGRYPEAGMFSENGGPIPDLRVIADPDIFGDVVETLQEGGLNLDSMLSRQVLTRGREPSPPLFAHIKGQDNIRTRSYSPQSHKALSISPESRSKRSSRAIWAVSPVARHSPVELPAEVPTTATARTFTIQATPLLTVPPPVALRRRRNSYPLHQGDEPNSRPGQALKVVAQHHQRSPRLSFSLSKEIGLVQRNTSPDFHEPAEPDSPSEESTSDSLDDEITWEFPFPFKQGLPCSPTDSVVCLASPRGPAPPDFAVCLRPEQLNLTCALRPVQDKIAPRIQHPRVQSMISLSEELERVDALDRLTSVGRRWDAVNRARTAGAATGRARSLSRSLSGELVGGLAEGVGIERGWR